MKVFLGGTVNGSNWREYIIPRLKIDYFDPVVTVWNDEAYELELYEKRHATYCLYVVTPKLTGYFSIAEVVNDAFHKPDQTIFCYLKEDQNYAFNDLELNTLDDLGQNILKNGGTWLRNLDEVISFLNQHVESENYDEIDNEEYTDCFISYGKSMSNSLSSNLISHFEKNSFTYWIDDKLSSLGPEKIEYINSKIRSTGNFIFIISPQSVKSEICLRELEFAVKNHKSIIVIHHIAPSGDWEKARLILKDLKWYYFDDNALNNILNELNEKFNNNKENKILHAYLLNKSINWLRNEKDEDNLLYGKERIDFSKWLSKEQEYGFILNELEKEFIQESLNQFFFTRLINKLAQKIEFITEHHRFESVISFISFLNPIAILPQLIAVLNDSINGNKSNGVSSLTFLIFLLINISLFLVWIKQRNKFMVAQTFLSILLIKGILISLLLQ